MIALDVCQGRAGGGPGLLHVPDQHREDEEAGGQDTCVTAPRVTCHVSRCWLLRPFLVLIPLIHHRQDRSGSVSGLSGTETSHHSLQHLAVPVSTTRRLPRSLELYTPLHTRVFHKLDFSPFYILHITNIKVQSSSSVAAWRCCMPRRHKYLSHGTESLPGGKFLA